MLPKISAQNSVLNKYSPSFCLDNPATGQIVVWDSDKNAFVNANISDLNLTTPGGVDRIEQYTVIGSGTQAIYQLPWVAQGIESLIVTIQGIKQHQSAFSINVYDTFTNLILSENLPAGVEMEVIGLIVTDQNNIKFSSFTGTGSTFQYTLPWAAPGPESLFITIDGIKQQQSAYSITVTGNQTQLTFSSPPAAGANIEIVGIIGSFGSSVIGLEEVKGNNLSFVGEGIFDSVVTAGSSSTLNFKRLRKGRRIELTSDGTGIEISLKRPTVRNELINLYRLNLIDEIIVFRANTPIIVEIPDNTSIPFEVGTSIELIQATDNGIITVTKDPAVTVIAKDGFQSKGKGSILRLLKINPNEWVISEKG